MKHLIILLAFVFVAGCATSSKSGQNTSGPMNDPPEDPATGEMPKGPEPVVEGNAPEDYKKPETEEGAAVTRAEVESFMDRGPAYVLTVVTVDPKRDETGQMVGYQIIDVTTEARAVMMPQLRVGDVVTHVNGVRLLKPDDLIQAWKALKQIDVAVVDFTRGDESMQASWSIQ